MNTASAALTAPLAPPSSGFQEARRELTTLTAGVERRVLGWLAARLPSWVEPDHLTVLGLLGMAGAGLCYRLASGNPLFLQLASVCLALNWFGDSLDGTLARYRRRTRPRYGFYVDHMVDAFGALFLLGGLGSSTFMSPAAAAALLVAYFLLSIHIALATVASGVFRIGYGHLGGTELRMILMAVNLLAFFWPTLALGGMQVALFDLLGGGAALGLLALTLFSCGQLGARLAEEERLPPR